MSIKVKWGKETLDVPYHEEWTLLNLKEHLHTRTSIPIDKQKLMGIKPAAKEDWKLSAAGIAAGKAIMLIGTAENTVIPSAQLSSDAAEEAGGHTASSPTSNGLQNIANTCYMNSAIQMLRMIPELKESIRSYTGPSNVVKQLSKLFDSLDNSKEAVMPLTFWTALVQQNPVFGQRDDHGGFMQQDAQEVLAYLLQEIKPILPRQYAQLYSGMLEQRLVCSEVPEDKGTLTYSDFSLLSCNVAGEVQTLEIGLEAGFNEDFKAQSQELGREAAFKRTGRIQHLPEYLIVHMVRFSWKSDIQKKAKILKPITFPLVLDTSMLCSDELREEQKPVRAKVMERRDAEIAKRKRSRNEVEADAAKKDKENPEKAGEDVEGIPEVLHNESGYYELCGVISHKGRSADGGHYVYWGKKADQWLIFDDQHVAAVSEEDVLRLRGVGEAHIAYVLLYRSRNPVTKKPTIPT